MTKKQREQILKAIFYPKGTKKTLDAAKTQEAFDSIMEIIKLAGDIATHSDISLVNLATAKIIPELGSLTFEYSKPIFRKPEE